MTHLTPSELCILAELVEGPIKQDHLLSSNTGFSIPALYLAIRELVKKKIITKTGDVIGMNLLWIEKELNDLKTLQDNHLFVSRKTKYLQKFPTNLKSGGRVCYKFTNYIEMDTMWSSIIITLTGSAKKTDWLYTWDPVPFWFICDEEAFKNSIKILKTINCDSIYAYAPTTNPELSQISRWSRKQKIRASPVIDKGLPTMKTINVFGDYCVTADLGKLFYQIKNYYSDKLATNKENLLDIMRNSVFPLKLTIENNKKKVEKYKKIFKKHFTP